MVGAVTAAVAAVASVGVGIYAATQAGSAASAQERAMNTQLDFEKAQWGAQAPYRQQLSDLMANPSSVTSLPGYEFNKQQGEESVARQFASNPGGAGSAALVRYGQDYASNVYQQQAQLLAQLSGISNNPAQYGSVGQGYGSNAISGQGQSFNQLQQLLAQGGATMRMFGPQGVFGASGTPTNPGTSGAQGGPGGLPMVGWVPEG
jgi:hypothetical protein